MAWGTIDKPENAVLVNFHGQFAENQRHREQSLLRLVVFFAAVLGYFAYAMTRLNPELKPIETCFLQVGVGTVLAFGCVLITILSSNFRRDQNWTERIRRDLGLLDSGKPLQGYSDVRAALTDKRLCRWMPDFYVAFLCLFLVFILLSLAFLISRKASLLGHLGPAVMVYNLALILFVFWTTNSYRLKTLSKIEVAFAGD